MPSKHFTKRRLVALAVIIFFIIGGFWAWSWMFSPSPGWGSCIPELPELSIAASYNGTIKTLDLNVTSMVNQTISFCQLTITDSKNNLQFKSSLPSVQLHPSQNISLSTNMGDTTLNQGNDYKIELTSTSGQKYSTYLTLFEWLQVFNVTYSSPKVLLVEVNSTSNQTIFFDHATIYQWKEQEGTKGGTTPHYITITEGTLSPNRILSKQNMTVTINLQQEIKPGTYDLWLSYSPPPYVRGGERVNFVVP